MGFFKKNILVSFLAVNDLLFFYWKRICAVDNEKPNNKSVFIFILQ